MVKNNSDNDAPRQSGVEQILMERERLEKILAEKYRKEVTILFSDICGYTQYIDRRGDISGRTLLMKHNRILLPIIDQNRGRVVEIIGDAVMAAFSEPLDAVSAAIKIQQSLTEHNQTVAAADQIHVKIGINVGEAIMDDQADYQSMTGDVANLAARIQNQAEKGEILVSKALFQKVCGCEDILCRFHKTVELKGKAKPNELFRVIWQDESVALDEMPKYRVYRESESTTDRIIPTVFHLEVNREGDRLKISGHEGLKGEANTIRNYEDIDASIAFVDSRCKELVDTLNKANQRGHVTRDVLFKLREIGQILYDELFTMHIKEKLKSSRAEFLCLNLDENLVHIPWELLNDGQQFLCQRFGIGRIVRTRQALTGIKSRNLARPLYMLILSDPTGDLKGAYSEGKTIRDFLDNHVDLFNVSLRSDDICIEDIRKKIRNFDIVHFAGHAEFQTENPEMSGWRLSDGIFRTADIRKMAGSASMPALIFSNSCQSARTTGSPLAAHYQSEIFGLANAFLLAGVKHYVGTFWEIMDEPSSRFALEFYKAVVAGAAVGEAARLARMALIKEYGEENIVWASYLLYGDPTYSYLDQVRSQKIEPVQTVPSYEATEPNRTREEVIDFATGSEKKAVKKRWPFVVAGFALVAFLFWAYGHFTGKEAVDIERQALAYFNNGQYTEAVNSCRILQEKYPDRPTSHLILGSIYLSRGDKQRAQYQYQKASQTPKGFEVEKAQAMVGLGRIASVENDKEQALRYYQEAATLSPLNSQAYVSQAVLLANDGKYEESLRLFTKADQLNPGQPGLNAIIKETREKAAFVRDREKQARLDQLVEELLKKYNESKAVQKADEWTSRPLTVWLMDFRTHGVCLREGEDLLLHSALVEKMLDAPRVQIVERLLIEKLMAELKLGTTGLVSQETALSLGRILAARVIVVGQIFYQETQNQLAFRIIETETGEIRASLNKAYPESLSTSNVPEELSHALIEKLTVLFPLRGRISKVSGDEVTLNIGTKNGVISAQNFKVVGTDTTLTIQDLQSDFCVAKAGSPGSGLKEGMRVEAY